MIQKDGKISAAALGNAVGVPGSTANDRIKRLESSGVIKGWRAVLDPSKVNAGLCAFVIIDTVYEGELDAVASLKERPEVMELHHISGAHSYLAKIRVADMAAVQKFLTEAIKSLKAVVRTETIFALDTVKESADLPIDEALPGEAPPS